MIMGTDTLRGDFCGRYKPIPVARLRVSPLVKKRILGLRSRNHPGVDFVDDARLTVIIPFRDREDHLTELVPVLKRTLEQQGLVFRIVVVEQTHGKLFNRGMLKNVGAHYARENSDYFCFHDVDMLPLEANYSCPSSPLRLIKYFESTWRESRSLGGHNFGGVVSIRKDDYLKINGYSNNFWGWGKEDDEFFIRAVLAGLVPFEDCEGAFRELANPETQTRSAKKIIKTNKKQKDKLLRGYHSFKNDGFTTLAYEIVSSEDNGDYCKLTVRI
jgi:hypothetical protein